VFGEADLESGRVQRGRVIVGTCSSKWSYKRVLFDDVGLVSVLVRRGRVSLGTCWEKSG